MQCKIRYYSLKSYLTCSMPLLPIFQAGVAFQLTFFIISHFWQIRTFGEKTFLIFCSAFLFKLPSGQFFKQKKKPVFRYIIDECVNRISGLYYQKVTNNLSNEQTDSSANKRKYTLSGYWLRNSNPQERLHSVLQRSYSI